MVKQGDTVEIDGAKVTVEGSWGQGKHMAYRLSDGRVVMDLHLMIESGAASIVPLQRIVKQKPLRPMHVDIDLDALKREVDESEE